MKRSVSRFAVVLVVLFVLMSGATPVAALGGATDTSSVNSVGGTNAPFLQVDGDGAAENETGDDDGDEEDDGNGSDGPATVDDAVSPSEVGDGDDEDDSGAGDDGPGVGVGAGSGGGPGASDNGSGSISIPVDGSGGDNESGGGEDGVGAGNESEGADGDGDGDGDESDDGDEDDGGGGGGLLGGSDGSAQGTTGTGGGLGIGGGGGSSALDPGSWLGGMVEWVFEDLMNGIEEFIDRFSMFVTSVPAPGEPTDPMSWYYPDDPVWETIWMMYAVMVALSAPWLTVNFMQALSLTNPIERAQMLKENLVTLFFYPIGPFIIGGFCHLCNAITGGLTPSAAEFLASPEGLSQLGVGIILGAVIAKASPIILFIGVAIIVLIAIIIMTSAAVSPLAMTGRSSGWPTARSMGNLVMTSIVLLGALRVLQSIFLRLFFEIPLDELSADLLVVFLLVNAIGLYYILYRFPKEIINKTFAASAMTLGISYMRKDFSAKQAYANAKQSASRNKRRVGKAANYVQKRIPRRGGGGGSGSRSSGQTSRSSPGSSSGAPTRAKMSPRGPNWGSSSGSSAANSSRASTGSKDPMSNQSRNMKRTGTRTRSNSGGAS